MAEMWGSVRLRNHWIRVVAMGTEMLDGERLERMD